MLIKNEISHVLFINRHMYITRGKIILYVYYVNIIEEIIFYANARFITYVCTSKGNCS